MDTIIFIYTENCAKLKTDLLLVIKINLQVKFQAGKNTFFKKN